MMPELTRTSLITGVLLAIIFGAANAYLGLRVGMTVSASIPAAVIYHLLFTHISCHKGVRPEGRQNMNLHCGPKHRSLVSGSPERTW